ncbi:MAG: amidohydrolase family protein [Planctomycetes bacterium]|nr:amidohydrolase family protein [Planctomycetota bacterium]
MYTEDNNCNRRKFLGCSITALAGTMAASSCTPVKLDNPPVSQVEYNNSESLVESKSILIKNGFVITMNARKSIYPQGQVLIRDGKIIEVGESLQTPVKADLILDAKQKLVLPGFVNAHAHLQQYFRGVYELIGNFYQVNLPLEGYRTPEDMNTLGAASCAELIHGGCTTSLIIYTYPHGFAKAVEKAGNRCVLAADIEQVDLNVLKSGTYKYLPEKGEAAFQRAVDLYHNWHGRADNRITTCMCPKAADLVLPEIYAKILDFAQKHDLPITTHLSQTSRETRQVRQLYDKTSTQHLFDMGFLNEKLTGVHCDDITEKDLQLILESGMGIMHCRSVGNPVMNWKDLGIRIGLGTDDYHHDMLPLLRDNLQGRSNRSRRPTFYELLEMATIGGAQAIGLDAEIGSLEAGKKADIITVDLNNPYLTPTREPITSFVLYGSSRDIDNVLVDGRFLKRNGQLTTIDMAQTLSAAQDRVLFIIDKFFQEHPEQKKAWESKVPYFS